MIVACGIECYSDYSDRKKVWFNFNSCADPGQKLRGSHHHRLNRGIIHWNPVLGCEEAIC